MGCTDFVVKYSLFLVNGCVAIFGISLIVAGSILLTYTTAVSELVPEIDTEVPILMTLAGCIIFLISSCGCCGAVAQKPFLLNMYAFALLVLSGFQLYIVILAHRLISIVENLLNQPIDEILALPEFVDGIPVFEAAFQCCGITGSDSYELVEMELPTTCCPLLEIPPINDIAEDLHAIKLILQNMNATYYNYCTSEESFSGCKPIIKTYMYWLYGNIISFCVIILAAELISTFFSFYLSQHIKNENFSKNKKSLQARA